MIAFNKRGTSNLALCATKIMPDFEQNFKNVKKASKASCKHKESTILFLKNKVLFIFLRLLIAVAEGEISWVGVI